MNFLKITGKENICAYAILNMKKNYNINFYPRNNNNNNMNSKLKLKGNGKAIISKFYLLNMFHPEIKLEVKKITWVKKDEGGQEAEMKMMKIKELKQHEQEQVGLKTHKDICFNHNFINPLYFKNVCHYQHSLPLNCQYGKQQLFYESVHEEEDNNKGMNIQDAVWMENVNNCKLIVSGSVYQTFKPESINSNFKESDFVKRKLNGNQQIVTTKSFLIERLNFFTIFCEE